MEELVQVTRKNVPVKAKNLQALQERVPGIYNDVNTGLDFGNAFMDTASKVVQHKYNIPAAAINVGNIDLSNALRDLGGDPSRIYNREDDQDLAFILGISPGVGTGIEIAQLIKGEDLVTGRKYGPEDYGWGTLSGGTTRVIGKVVGKIGDLEKKGKAIENATKGTSGIGWSMPRGGGVINGRKYTEHALERMAPDTLEIRAELNSRAREMAAKKGYKLGSAEYNELFSKIDPRGMTPNVVEDIIKTGSRAPADTPGTWKYSRADGYVILNDNGDVITAVPAKKK